MISLSQHISEALDLNESAKDDKLVVLYHKISDKIGKLSKDKHFNAYMKFDEIFADNVPKKVKSQLKRGDVSLDEALSTLPDKTKNDYIENLNQYEKSLDSGEL